MSTPFYRVVLAKSDFKFSAAHFTLFSATQAEPLHGHNYRVRVEVEGPELDELGLLIDFDSLKREIRAACRRLDDRTLIPAASPLLTVESDESHVDVQFCERSYRFPCDEVVLLDITNTTGGALRRTPLAGIGRDARYRPDSSPFCRGGRDRRADLLLRARSRRVTASRGDRIEDRGEVTTVWDEGTGVPPYETR